MTDITNDVKHINEQHNEQHGLPPESARQLLQEFRAQLFKIPIVSTVELVYVPTGSWVRALVTYGCSQEDIKIDFEEVVFVEAGSKNGLLSLLDVTKQPDGINPPWHKSLDESGQPTQSFFGSYDRNPETREIAMIYLLPSDIAHVRFTGTLKDLLRHPNIRRRQ